VLAAHVAKAEAERTLQKTPATWQAYDYYLRAADVFTTFLTSWNKQDLYKTRQLIERALFIDPNYARAYAFLSTTHMAAWLHLVDSDHLQPVAIDRAYHSDWRFAIALIFVGDPARAILVLESHLRVDPFYPPMTAHFLGVAHYMLEQYSEALPPFQECATRTPNFRPVHSWLAATYAQLGQLRHAQVEAEEVLRLDPSFSIGRSAAYTAVFKNQKDAEHLFDGLRKAGLPEK
jgi:adenylate cyclase